MARRFNDQVVVVTGGGRGIGRATALEFAAEGAKLMLAGRRLDALRTTAGEVADAGGTATVVHCDVAGIAYRAYFPAGSIFPSIVTGVENEIVVFSFAPVRHGESYGTRPFQIFRLFTAGRW